MDKFAQPHEISDVDMAFPASVRELMPAYSDIPDEFKRQNNRFVRFQQTWFFLGLAEIPPAKEGIDQKAAMRHLSCIQRSFEPKHEHKEAAVAYLASRWLEVADDSAA